MKVLHIEARSDIDIREIAKKVKFEGKLGLLSTIQLVHKLKDLQKLIPDSIIGGQVLGCNVSLAKEIQDKVDAFLYLGSGEFHPLEIALETGKRILWANPYSNEVKEIEEKEIEKRRKMIRGAYLRFLASKEIGILVSTKKGQNQLKKAKEFQKSLDKKSYIFLFNTLDFQSLENFPDIECWVNTACPRMAIEDYKKFHKPVINLSDLEHMKQAK